MSRRWNSLQAAPLGTGVPEARLGVQGAPPEQGAPLEQAPSLCSAQPCAHFLPQPRHRSLMGRYLPPVSTLIFYAISFPKSSRWGPEAAGPDPEAPGGFHCSSHSSSPSCILVKPIFPPGRKKKEGFCSFRTFLRNPFPRRSSTSSVLMARPGHMSDPNPKDAEGKMAALAGLCPQDLSLLLRGGGGGLRHLEQNQGSPGPPSLERLLGRS